MKARLPVKIKRRLGLTPATTPGKSKGEKAVSPPAKSMAEVMPSIVQMLEEWRVRCRTFQAAVDDYLKKAHVPKKQDCPAGGPAHLLDVDESARVSWINKPEMHAIYAPCPACAARLTTDEDLRLQRNGAGKIFLKAKFENWALRTSSDAGVIHCCRKFASNPSGFLILQGPIGLGKTHLCVAIMRAAGIGRLVTQNHFLMMLRETYRNPQAPNPVELFKTAKLLLLDELGVSAGGKDEFPALYEVINHRYADGLPTVVTTNVEPSEFASVFGDRIADRLVTGTICQLKGESWRRPK